jgi:hypothetical protein
MSETASAGVTVNLEPDQAFDLFARRLAAWWPPEYSWSQDVLEEIGIEPHEGGMCFERDRTVSAATGGGSSPGTRRDGC